MNYLTTPAEKELLEENLESLHRQCRSWISQVAFWEDEQKFFVDLISSKLFQISDKERKDIQGLLQTLSGDDTLVFKEALLKHEVFLFNLLKTNNAKDRIYRGEHKALSQKFDRLEAKIKSVKKSVFVMSKLLEQNSFNGNETLHTIYERRAVRKYKAQPVQKHLIEDVLKAAAMAPSAINQQPWKFYVVADKQKLKKYASETLNAADTVYHELLKHISKSEDPIFHSAPVVIFITAPKGVEWAGLDVGLCAQNLMLAAKSMGLDTCPVGLGNFIGETPSYRELRIPDGEKILLTVVLGYGDEKPEIHPRKTDTVLFL